MIEDAREGILELLGAKTGGMDADQLVFTSGGTEANNLALLGLASIPSAGTKLGPGEAGNRFDTYWRIDGSMSAPAFGNEEAFTRPGYNTSGSDLPGASKTRPPSL